MSEITLLLEKANAGVPTAGEELLPLVRFSQSENLMIRFAGTSRIGS